MTRITSDWLKDAAHLHLFKLFGEAGFMLFYVGGCVRNALIGSDASDIDMATDATPEQMELLATANRLKVLPIGKDHGTLTFVIGAGTIEITTFRADVETDGRHAEVRFSKNLSEDAARRDFTINALYADADGNITDPMNGLPDIEARRIRFIGDPNARILEDHLRILRFFRFHAWYGAADEGLDANGLAACAANAGSLELLSRERIGLEMRKLLSAVDPAPSIAAMSQSGILARVMTGADPVALAPLIHLEADLAPNWIRRAAVLGRNSLTEIWRLSRAETKSIALLRDLIGSKMGAPEIAYRHGLATARDVLLLRAAIFEDPNLLIPTKSLEAAASAKFPVRATDLPIEITGPEIGKTLRVLEKRWIASEFTLSKSELLR